MLVDLGVHLGPGGHRLSLEGVLTFPNVICVTRVKRNRERKVDEESWWLRERQSSRSVTIRIFALTGGVESRFHAGDSLWGTICERTAALAGAGGPVSCTCSSELHTRDIARKTCEVTMFAAALVRMLSYPAPQIMGVTRSSMGRYHLRPGAYGPGVSILRFPPHVRRMSPHTPTASRRPGSDTPTRRGD